MSALRRLRDNERGAAAIEFAIAVPVLVLFIWGIFQVALLFQAQAGMKHALGEAARYATVCLNPTAAGCTSPTEEQLTQVVTSKKFGVGNGTWGTPQYAWDAAARTVTISVNYSQPTDFLFFAGPTVNLNASKLVYLPT